MIYLGTFVSAQVASLIVTMLAIRLSRRWGIVAEPGGRRRHQGRIPKLGGLPLAAGFLLGVALTYVFLPPTSAADAIRLRGIVIGGLFMLGGGLLDDRFDLPAVVQLAIQLLGAAIAMTHLIFIEVFTNPFPWQTLWMTAPLAWVVLLEGNLVWLWRPLALLVTLLWVVGMVNTVNWLDGLDGLATGVGTIAALLFAWHSYSLGQETVAAFPLALAGALIGFLVFNFAPARIFLGSGGAYFLGYCLATMSILSPAKFSTALLVLAVPILDVAWQIANRLRRGQNPLQGDRGHLHFRLSDGGLPTRRIVLGYYGVAIAFGVVAVLVASPLLKLLLLLVLSIAVILLLARLSARDEQAAGREAG